MQLQVMVARPFVSSLADAPTSPPILTAPKPKKPLVFPGTPAAVKHVEHERSRNNLHARPAKRRRNKKKKRNGHVGAPSFHGPHQVLCLKSKEMARGKTAFDRLMADEKKGRTEKNWRTKGQNPCKAHSVKARKRRIAKRAKAPKKPIIRTKERSAYLDYLDQPLWRETIRPRILERDGRKCRVCTSRKRLQVHHRSYAREVMLGRDDSQLITLCRACHLTIEFVNYDENDPTKTIRRSRGQVEPRLLELLQAQAARIRDVPAAE